VTFINTDGMSFIGPGSEWLWTAVSGIVLAVTFLAIYRQLRAQRAANAIDLRDRLRARWESARMINVQLHLARALKADDEPDVDTLAAMVALFFDELAGLIERGYCDESASEDYGVALLQWWTFMRPGSARSARSTARASLSVSSDWLEGRRRPSRRKVSLRSRTIRRRTRPGSTG
jgi:hypothetical protein